MTDTFNETLRNWQNFYFMIGGAAAGLAGLIFVAVSLGMHRVTGEMEEDINIFVSPSIFYFVLVLLLSCVMLVPIFTASILALILFLGGIVGLLKTTPIARRLLRAAKKNQDFDLWEHLTQIILPVGSYGLILVAALCFAVDQRSFAFFGTWISAILLLICAISNTWSLVLWIIA